MIRDLEPLGKITAKDVNLDIALQLYNGIEVLELDESIFNVKFE